jgi:hypothetical protein
MANRSKLTRASDSPNLQALITNYNANLDVLEQELESTLSRRDNILPNSMEDVLDMNGYDIINVGSITSGGGGADDGWEDGQPDAPKTEDGNPVGGNITNVVYGNDYTLNTLDAGSLIVTTNAAPVTITIPEETATLTFPLLSQIVIHQEGAGQVSIVTATSNIYLRYPVEFESKTSSRYSTLYLQKRDQNRWILGGDLSMPIAPPTPPSYPPPPAVPTLAVPTGIYKNSKAVEFRPDGAVYIQALDNSYTNIGRWYPAGTPDVITNYYVYCSMSRGDMENNASAARNTWLSLSSTRRWVVENSTSTRWMDLLFVVKHTDGQPQANNSIYVSRNG